MGYSPADIQKLNDEGAVGLPRGHAVHRRCGGTRPDSSLYLPR
ncbi:MAG: hypothetical protein AAB369_00315 [Chloroflexota bacterium]